MLKHICLFFLLSAFTQINAQELDCNVVVNANQISVSNNQIFQTLENALTEFINQTKWTNTPFKKHEQIKCGYTIIITEQKSTNSFTANIQIQASRPVFNSTYYSPILNYKDNSFNFSYTEYQPLNYNPNGFESNLIAVITYYNYLILGMYADTFSYLGGEQYLKTALKIANQAQQSGASGWRNTRTNTTKFTIIDRLLSSSGDQFRQFLHKYHYDVLDSFERNQKSAAKNMVKTILKLEDIYQAEQNNNNTLIRFLLDAKTNEIVNMFNKNRGVKTEEMVDVLKKISSNNTKKWKQIYKN